MTYSRTDVMNTIYNMAQQISRFDTGKIGPVQNGMRLQGDLGMDSIDMAELCMKLESKFNIRIQDNIFEVTSQNAANTIGAWADCVCDKICAKNTKITTHGIQQQSAQNPKPILPDLSVLNHNISDIEKGLEHQTSQIFQATSILDKRRRALLTNKGL